MGLEGKRASTVGLALAVFAATFSMGIALWPASPQAQQLGSMGWLWTTFLTGGLFILAGGLADEHTFIARALLLLGVLARTASAFIFGRFTEAGLGGAILDLLPAVMALAAIPLVGPYRDTARVQQVRAERPR